MRVKPPDDLKKALEKYCAQFGYEPETVKFILSLSALESGRWTSSLWKNFNNPFGMRPAMQRKTSREAEITENNFAIYSSVENAALDFVYWLNAKRAPKAFADLKAFIYFTQSKGYEPFLSADEYYSRVVNAIK